MTNKKHCNQSSLIFDEFATIYFNGIDNLIATARSNKFATTLAAQDASQLKMHYGAEQADVIMNIVGNIISGQVSGNTAKQLPKIWKNVAGQAKHIYKPNRYQHYKFKTTGACDTYQ